MFHRSGNEGRFIAPHPVMTMAEETLEQREDSRNDRALAQGQRPRKRRRVWRVLGYAAALFILLISIIMIDIWSAFGSRAEGARLERMQRSPQYADGQFFNALPERQIGSFFAVLQKWLLSDKAHREPLEPLPIVTRAGAEFVPPVPDLRITWLGHSTLLVEIEGRRILTDPVWGKYASPGRLFGVERFYAPPLPLDELPVVDAVVLSHDHYDHLNEETIRALATRIPRFIAPLGLGAHLEYWGVPAENITELDWWERTSVEGLEVVSTPARHFSGRSLTDRNATLWSSWAFIGAERRVYFSGDTGMFPGFEEIGQRLGPFDMTMMETGAYNAAWADIHMGPEQAVRAHQMVRGRLMLPIHWGTFNLAFHGWTEPVERVLTAAEHAGVTVALPRPGESIAPDAPRPDQRWWPAVPWQTAEEAPIVSSGLPASAAVNTP